MTTEEPADRSERWAPGIRQAPDRDASTDRDADTLAVARTLRSTNAVESMISISRDHARNVTRWRDGQMALRWCAAGMVEASKQFRRVNGHLHLPALRTALERHVAAQTVGTHCNTQDVSAA